MKICFFSLLVFFASFAPLNAEQTSSNTFMIIQEDNKELELERVISFYDSVKDYQDARPLGVRKHYFNAVTEKGRMVTEGVTPTGTFIGYSPDGKKVAEYSYKNGVPYGVLKEFYKDSDQIQSELFYKDGKQIALINYDVDGNVSMKELSSISGGVCTTERTIYNYSTIFGYAYDQEIWRQTTSFTRIDSDIPSVRIVKGADNELLFMESYSRDERGLGKTYEIGKTKLKTEYLVIPNKNLSKRIGIFELSYNDDSKVSKVCYYSLVSLSGDGITCTEEPVKILKYTNDFNMILASRKTKMSGDKE